MSAIDAMVKCRSGITVEKTRSARELNSIDRFKGIDQLSKSIFVVFYNQFNFSNEISK